MAALPFVVLPLGQNSNAILMGIFNKVQLMHIFIAAWMQLHLRAR